MFLGTPSKPKPDGRTATSMPIYFLSEPQTKEVRDLFDFLDTDRDGLLSVEQALSLCRQLGFHVNKATLDLHDSHVIVRRDSTLVVESGTSSTFRSGPSRAAVAATSSRDAQAALWSQ